MAKIISVLVLGGTGFIGRYLVGRLAREGYQIYVFACHKNTGLDVTNIEFIQGDILDNDTLSSAFKDKDIVFHLAAATDVRLPYKVMYNINVIGTKNVLEACLKNKVKHLIYISTIGVLGSNGNSPLKEADPYNPKINYEITKAEAEKLCIEYYKRFNLPVTIIRPTAVYGPSERWLRSFQQAKKGTPIIGKGKNSWHLVYIDDVIDVLELVMKRDNTIGEIYHIADNQAHTYKEVYRIMRETLGLEEAKKHIPIYFAKILAFLNEIYARITNQKPTIVRADIYRLIKEKSVDISKAKTQLGYNPKYNLESGFRKTFAEFRKSGLI